MDPSNVKRIDDSITHLDCLLQALIAAILEPKMTSQIRYDLILLTKGIVRRLEELEVE